MKFHVLAMLALSSSIASAQCPDVVGRYECKSPGVSNYLLIDRTEAGFGIYTSANGRDFSGYDVTLNGTSDEMYPFPNRRLKIVGHCDGSSLYKHNLFLTNPAVAITNRYEKVDSETVQVYVSGEEYRQSKRNADLLLTATCKRLE